MEKYQEYIASINEGIIEFSNFLKLEYYLSPIDNSKLKDPKHSWDLTRIGWDETSFPNGTDRGVYFIFGKKKNDDNKLGVYVGKASNSSMMGKRLNSHLNNSERHNKIYPMRDNVGDEFLLEYVVTYPMEGLFYFAPALEEFLIYFLQDKKVYLLNGVGKY